MIMVNSLKFNLDECYSIVIKNDSTITSALVNFDILIFIEQAHIQQSYKLFLTTILI